MFSRVAALVLKMPELAIDDAEAKELGKNLAEVLAYYDYRPSGPAMAWTALLTSLAMIYTPRLLQIYNRTKSEKAHAQ